MPRRIRPGDRPDLNLPPEILDGDGLWEDRYDANFDGISHETLRKRIDAIFLTRKGRFEDQYQARELTLDEFNVVNAYLWAVYTVVFWTINDGLDPADRAPAEDEVIRDDAGRVVDWHRRLAANTAFGLLPEARRVMKNDAWDLDLPGLGTVTAGTIVAMLAQARNHRG